MTIKIYPKKIIQYKNKKNTVSTLLIKKDSELYIGMNILKINYIAVFQYYKYNLA